MPIWQATMDSVFYDETPANEHEECNVRIDNSHIEVTYEDEEGNLVLYAGSDEGNGHFTLECQLLNARATLHQIPNSRVLEGYWVEQGARGFWKITLANEPK